MLRIRIALAAGTLSAMAVLAAGEVRAQEDDWVVLERRMNYGEREGVRAQEEETEGDEQARTLTACGISARAAEEPYKSIVAQINRLWGVDFPVYESVKIKALFAKRGGCVFYNREFFAGLFGTWMNVRDAKDVTPLLYAVFAHEIGHLYHNDFDWRRDGVSAKVKELGADQFAGYTLARFNLRLDPDDITKYYQLIGDDFVGGWSDHGTGKERAQAFTDGWRRGRAGVPEESARPAGGLGSDYQIR